MAYSHRWEQNQRQLITDEDIDTLITMTSIVGRGGVRRTVQRLSNSDGGVPFGVLFDWRNQHSGWNDLPDDFIAPYGGTRWVTGNVRYSDLLGDPRYQLQFSRYKGLRIHKSQ